MKKSPKKLNRKGFSMVELVIVIAIMAVLVAVLAPTYIKYVDRSRTSTDETVADEIAKAVKVMATDEDYSGKIAGTTYTITWKNNATSGNGEITVEGSNATDIAGYLKAILDIDGDIDSAITGETTATIAASKIQSNAHKAQTYTVTFTVGTGDVSGVWA